MHSIHLICFPWPQHHIVDILLASRLANVWGCKPQFIVSDLAPEIIRHGPVSNWSTHMSKFIEVVMAAEV